jgi:hypothetical protein
MIIASNHPTDTGRDRSRPCGMFAVDIVDFSAADRDDQVRRFLHRTIYELLEQAFEDAQLGWNDCLREDRGDGVLMIVPALVPSATVISPLLNRLLAGLRRHNRVVTKAARIQLRVAMHYGEVHLDDHGVAGAALIHVFRLLDAPVLKRALSASGGDLALIVSDYFYESVIRREPVLSDPAVFQRVRVAVKETRAHAWLHLPGVSAGDSWRQPGKASPTPRSAIAPARPHQTGENPVGILPSLQDPSNQALDSILAAGEAEELERIQVGLNLDVGLAAIMRSGSQDQVSDTNADDSGEPQILAEVASNPRTPEVLPFRWMRKGSDEPMSP